ncbi:unnamed protein product, partial [Mesorhabditis belari]|uniref:Alpha-(1,6)-fucosyltransferase n=1 Tax=Mesorhabditis belari TaxID=2138241 RepID=A0AAF3F155_9BILA
MWSVKSAAVVALIIWVIVLLYLSQSLFSLQGKADSYADASGVTSRLDEALSNIRELKKQNDRLQEMIQQERKDRDGLDKRRLKETEKVEKLNRIRENREEPVKLQEVAPKPLSEQGAASGPSRVGEELRRGLDQRIWEIFYYLRSEFKKSDKEPSYKNHTIDQLIHLLAYSSNISDTQADWRKASLEALSERIQKKIDEIQNPDDCAKARVLVCNLDKQCGFGCQLHHVGYCFTVAFGEGRTLILTNDGKSWRYSKRGWSGAFLPISKCTHAAAVNGEGVASYRQNSERRVVELPIVDALQDRPKTLPLSFPKQLEDEMIKLHSNPPLYFISQFLWYLMRNNAEMEKVIEKAVSNVPFGEGPIVGIQVRRTDKIGTEASFHSVDEYMEWTEIWFRVQELRRGHPLKRRVFVASDDASVLPETKKKYSNYEVFGDVDIADTAKLMSRYSDASMYGVVTDIQLLSRCDYLVCTFSSQVCRMGYELMQVRRPDGEAFHSLDDLYYYGGQHDHQQIVIEDHVPERDNEIELKVGDSVGVAGNHWDGYSKGKNRRTQRQGLYPSYKVIEKWRIIDFPVFNN